MAIAKGIVFSLRPIFGIVYLAIDISSTLSMVKPAVDFQALTKTLRNGISEFLENAPQFIIKIVFNFQLIAYINEEGVADLGIVCYIVYIFLFVLSGFVEGSKCIISFC
ncbi:MAG: hypothetical protein HUJ51_02450 [Eggerthellaceae bacterium]|nr:hypothetical protein [Eggerthellaceae bacterium]